MKKILITLLILSISTAVYAVDEENPNALPGVTYDDLNEENYFRSPMSIIMPESNTSNSDRYSGFDDYAFDYGGKRTYSEIDPDNMPLFKQLRLKIQNKLTTMEYASESSQKAKGNLLEKVKFWKKKQAVSDDTALTDDGQVIAEEGSIADSIQNETTAKLYDPDTIALESGISEQVTEKELQLDADNVNFDEETGEMVASGRPELFLPPQSTKIISDTMTYNQDSNILKAIGNVVILKDGMPTLADYAEVDMNEESMLMDNIRSKTLSMEMDAKKGMQKEGMLILFDGMFHSEQSEIHRMSSRMIGPRFTSMILDEEEKALFFGDPSGNKIHIDMESLHVEAKKNHDIFKAKNVKISKNGKYWFSWPSLTAYTNKDRNYFEANYPEFGTRRKLGMFIGPGFVFGGPGGSVMKAIPFLNYQDSNFGFGGALKFRNAHNSTYLGYGSAADIFFMKGHQRLDDNLFLQYSANSFNDEWFLGARMPKYMAEVYYDKAYVKKAFLTQGRDLRFRHRMGFGLMEDNDRNYYGEKIPGNSTTTTRLRYMAEIAQSLYSYRNPENKFYFDLSIALQGSAAVYGTGDTQFIGRIGPRAHIQYKNWMQDLGYFQTGFEDQTPVPRYDMYRYGNSSVYISEIIRLHKYLSVGWSGLVNLSDDSPNGKLFQENRFVFAIGPDDLKVRLGYDFVRRTTYFGFDVAFDTKGTTITYGRMEIKNPERLGQRDKEEERKLSFTPARKSQQETKVSSISPFGKRKEVSKPKVLQYAQVIEIEDPNKETIQ